MKRTAFLFAFILAVTPVYAKIVRGSVHGAGEPLAGVIVSDGYRFTTTRGNGTFCLNTHRDARFVFVVTPSGYVADYSSGAPQFYQPLKDKRSFSFELQPFGKGDDYTIFSVSDPQMQNEKHFRRFCGRPLEDLRSMAKEYGGERTTVGVVLGDIAWNRHWVFRPYKDSLATVGIPFYSVIGNHDFIQNRSGLPAAEAWEDEFGPCNYAFWLGRDLVIGVNDLLFKASGLEDPEKSSNNYKEGYPEDALGFVRGLLRYVPKGTHIYLAQHSPIRFVHEEKNNDIEGAAAMLSLLRGYEVDILSGHTHVMNKVRVSDTVMDNNAAAIGGAWWATAWCRDGTPRGWEIITSTTDGRSWRWHNIDYPDDFQVEFVGADGNSRHPGSIAANAWGATEGWTCTWTQDGEEMGELELTTDISVSYRKEIMDVYKGDFSKIPGYKRPVAERHFYVATPSEDASEATITVSAPDGRSWSHTFDLKDGNQ